ncbi:MAG: hypothetical protein IPP52_17195 [Ignavibacteria bacterium]|nr:hypothetical protein [Ignavibacteria bacterium]
MKKTQANKFVMLRTVVTLLERNEIIVSRELQAATNLLKTRTIELESADNLKRTALTGKKIYKDSVKESLIRSASGISGAINTYAKKRQRCTCGKFQVKSKRICTDEGNAAS